MIPELWNELGTEKIGDLNDCLECFVEEERNGIFELTLEYPNGYPLADQLLKEKIIVVNANDTLLNQKFRIYDTKKFLNETITVFARHISFDLMYDYVGDVTFENQSCEYALNSLFRQSQFSKHYRGYSDIVNAQNYSMSMCNILEAIGGKEGSIIDTFGTGAEILRDNTDIHVLNARGHDNDVAIEYAKNLTGFELEEDTTDLVTRILPYAKYTPEGGNETIVKGDFVDSPLINNYSHPYIKHIDYSDKFKDKQIPTKEKLETFARNEYRDNKVDIPKTNFKIEFIPLSKCVGYEELEDKISLCDKVTIKNIRYNVDTKAKVIKYKFDVLRERYERMELGEPRTTLGDIIGGGGDSQVGPPGPQGPPGADGSIGDFPNSLPQTPILTATVKGFASIDLSWTYEDKVYYTYEVYASKTKDFTPNIFDLIHSAQSSSFLFQAKPNETWYFRVCAKNTYGERTEFSPQITVNTVKEYNLSNYFTDMAIGKAVVGSLTADYMEAGIIKGNWIDMRHLTLTDGNGVRRLDIDSFGKFYLKPSVFMLEASTETNVPTKSELSNAIGVANSYTNSQIEIVNNKISQKVSQSEYNINKELINDKFSKVEQTSNSINEKVVNIEKDYVTSLELSKTASDITIDFNQKASKPNMVVNSRLNGLDGWKYTSNNDGKIDLNDRIWDEVCGGCLISNGNAFCLDTDYFIKIDANTTYVLSAIGNIQSNVKSGGVGIAYYDSNFTHQGYEELYFNETLKLSAKQFQAWSGIEYIKISINNWGRKDIANGSNVGVYVKEIKLELGKDHTPWCPSSGEMETDIIRFYGSGIKVHHRSNGNYTQMSSNGFKYHIGDTGEDYHALSMTGYLVLGGIANIFPKEEWVFLPASWRGRKFTVSVSLQQTRGGLQMGAEWMQNIELDVVQYNYENASFLVRGAWWSRTNLNEVYEKELGIRWMAIC